MKPILVATDFSVVSRNATVFAAHLAKTLQLKIILFHVYSIPTTVTDIAFMMVSAEEMQKENEDRIKKDADRIFTNFGVQVEWLVRIGIPSDEIKILADEKNADLVVMAIQGEGASSKFIGSTTLNTIQKIKKPVLVVPKAAMFDGISRATYATDFSYSTNEERFSVLLEIIKAYHSQLQILNIQKPDKKTGDNEPEGKAKLDEIFKNIPHELSIVEAESIMHGINEFTQKNNTQLLAMTMHKHNFFERAFGKNYTKEVAYETKIPLLVLHDNS
ncbi:MAG TPA: universal stress protein [Puia sp.]|jgi:nucleotide-binding universal stress UspA family protein|nr:universal stress protein [Puia sp.]